MTISNKISRMELDGILAKLSSNLHGDRSDYLKNTLVVKFKVGTEPRQYKDVASGAMCAYIDHIEKTVGLSNWAGKVFDFSFDSILGVFDWDEYQGYGGTNDAIANLFE